MYRTEKKINSIKSYASKSGFAIKEGMIYSLNQFSTILNDITKQIEIHPFGENHIITNDIRGNSKIININDFAMEERFKINAIKYPYFEFYSQETPRNYGIYDFSKTKILFETEEWIGRDICGDYIISFIQEIISIRKVNSARPLWDFNVQLLGVYDKLYSSEKLTYEVSKFLGIWQDELIVSCQGGLIFSLNIMSGDLVRKWDKLPEQADDNIKEVFRGGLQQSGHVYQLNLDGDKIIAIYYRHIIEINLATGEIDVINLIESLQRHNMSDFQLKSGYAEDETHYYTTVHFDKDKMGLNYIPTALCAINKNSKSIDWFYRFDEDGSGDYVSIQVPQVSDGKLYQLTANGTLHIFERE